MQLQVLVTVCLASMVQWAATAGENRFLLENGAVVLAHTGEYNKGYPVAALLEGDLGNYWASANTKLPVQRRLGFVIELARSYQLNRLVVDNREIDEVDYPGVSARDMVFFGSTESPTGPWTELARVEAARFARKAFDLEPPRVARWIKVEILSNYGSVSYTEINELEGYGDPVGEAATVRPADGIYRTNYGPLLLRVRGNRFEGCYEVDMGYVYGHTDGRVFDMNWIEHRGEEKGSALLVLADSGLINGLWYEEDIMKGPWFGNKAPAETVIDCTPEQAAAYVGFDRERWWAQ